MSLAIPAVRALHHDGYRAPKDAAKATPAVLASLHAFGPNAEKTLNEVLAEAV